MSDIEKRLDDIERKMEWIIAWCESLGQSIEGIEDAFEDHEDDRWR